MAVARRLISMTRETDVLGRIGNDEFAIVQTGTATVAAAEVFCLRLVEAFAEPFLLAGSTMGISVSVGVAIAPLHGINRTDLSRKADVALRAARLSGQGRYAFFDIAMDAGVQARLEIENALREALKDGSSFELVYQPLYDARSHQICGAEALLRWRHPARGMLPPAVFVPVAESSGLIGALGEWVLRRACRDAVDLRLPSVAVNVSAVEIRDPRFAARVISILKDAGLPPGRLEIEITETSLIENEAAYRHSLAALREEGIKVALDDFGTGYSSLSHLDKFEIDRIKIDQSFVGGIDVREGGRALLRAMVDLAKAKGLNVTAEGVQTKEQAGYLTEIGCGTLQGFYLSRPVTADRLAGLVRNLDKDLTGQARHARLPT